MDYAARRRAQGGLFEGLYKFIMRRNSVYVTFVIAGAFLGERAVDFGVHKLWEYNNVGVHFLILGISVPLLILWRIQLIHVGIVWNINCKLDLRSIRMAWGGAPLIGSFQVLEI
ncbi:hypothetical protein PTKIN_Ptkin13bG0248100 [Pterospermum kingtungense]